MQAKDFGFPLDPIYDGSLTQAQLQDVLKLRASFTGDDRERKEMLRQTTKWYPAFEEKMTKYYDQLEKNGFKEDPESKWGYTQRVKDYQKLSKEYPANTSLIDQYQAVKKADSAKGKQFYKDHLSQLQADYKRLGNERFDWTNKMRVAEGTSPMDRSTYDNLSYGYEDDERKLAQDLYWKNKDGYAKGNSSEKKYLLSLLSSNDTNAKSITLKKLQTAYKPGKMKSFVPSGGGKKVRIRLK